MDKRTPQLGDVQETLLIPLYARAVETRKPRGMLRDPRAVEMVDALDYDFSRFDGAKSLLGANLRMLLFNLWVRDFLERHPSGTVVEIGTGLNTRFERLDNGTVHWFDLDLPDVIALRRGFFEDTDRRRMIAASVTDPGWMEEVRRTSPGPYFLAAEAVLIYLEEELVRSVFRQIAEPAARGPPRPGDRGVPHGRHPGQPRRTRQGGRPDALELRRPRRPRTLAARPQPHGLPHPGPPAGRGLAPALLALPRPAPAHGHDPPPRHRGVPLQSVPVPGGVTPCRGRGGRPATAALPGLGSGQGLGTASTPSSSGK
ncbi:class I SAM-dependent methyltransferase [Streptomyces sp. GLT-R25]